ncbi:AGC family protein kinase [Trichomonas vaginalis G3]|uniref:AGC family protein kinase n=1 Tax=Trichomonas vaginalis (strain ATCC PRA-98 / G3) TaxID=412133 RepID=A2DRQ7_TRIV3|nr:glycogen cell differentiation involved in embryonic placenta development [Trichomonas vaginalis G3]EAY16854.1 AGC family protein kinase [Trichomonas vaginalis G3]KAI5489157.1 glycogen cell differentiation involved in embryonic placenta development [Trichomonas vaginalis G3]|eukprot:XP_001329077.1 AGC family protein kinase [Trichomonas vaginalis G3]
MSEALFVIKEGWLTKRGGLFKTWHKRWFYIIGKTLFYAKEPGIGEKGKILLDKKVSIAIAPESKKSFSFKIITPARIYIISAPDEATRASWVKILSSVIDESGQSAQLTEEDIQVVHPIDNNNLHIIQTISRKDNPIELYIMKAYNKVPSDPRFQEQVQIRTSFLKTRLSYFNPIKYILQTDNDVKLFYEYLPYGSLSKKIENEGNLSEDSARMYIAQVLTCLDNLHKNRIIYKDLKMSNVLINKEGLIIVTDPGLHLQPEISEYVAPEVIKSLPITESADWYSAGIILYEMICGLPPYWEKNQDALTKVILNGTLRFPHHVSRKAKNICARLLEKSPDKRLGAGELGFEEIKRDEFFANLNWESIANGTFKVQWQPPSS